MIRVAILLAAIGIMSAANAAELKELRAAQREFESIKHPTEADRVRYVTRLVRLREKLTRADVEAMEAIDAEVVRHPMPADAVARDVAERLVGRWQSPRRPYFYHSDGTWRSNEDIPGETGGTWRMQGNQFFQNYSDDTPARGETIILLTSTDFVYGSAKAPYYLRRGTAFPWRE